MANSTAVFGFKHIGYLGGGAPDYQRNGNYLILSTYSTKIGRGDAVQKTNGTSKYLIQGSATTLSPIVGVFDGCEFIDSNGNTIFSPFWPGTAGADAKAYVIDAPNAIFLAASLLTSVVTGNIGEAVNYSTGAAVSTTGGGFSNMSIDQSSMTSAGTTASGLPFRIVGLYQGVGNGSDFTTNFAWCVVGFNNQINRTLGVGTL